MVGVEDIVDNIAQSAKQDCTAAAHNHKEEKGNNL
jgi:hypothetical protein